MTSAGVLVGIVAGAVAIEVTLLGAAWRISGWHTRQEARLDQLAGRLDRIENRLGIAHPPARHRLPTRAGWWWG